MQIWVDKQTIVSQDLRDGRSNCGAAVPAIRREHDVNQLEQD